MTNEIQTTESMGIVTQKTYSPETIKTVKDTLMFPHATDQDLLMFLHKCNAAGVHPLDQKIFPMKYKDKLTFVSSIDYQRSKAESSQKYDGQDEPEYDDETMSADHPEWCKVKVYKKDITRPFVGTAKWSEFFPQQESKQFMWKKMPYIMLSKCAEAQALRRAFPDELNKIYVEEEMMQAASSSPKSTKPIVQQTKAIPQQHTATSAPATTNSSDSPDDETRKANKWISQKQEGRLRGLAKTAGIEKQTLLNLVKKKWSLNNLWELSWTGGQNSKYNQICTAVQEQPGDVQKYANSESSNATMDGDPDITFIDALREMGLKCDLTTDQELSKFLADEFSLSNMEKIPDNMYGKIIDRMQVLSETGM